MLAGSFWWGKITISLFGFVLDHLEVHLFYWPTIWLFISHVGVYVNFDSHMWMILLNTPDFSKSRTYCSKSSNVYKLSALNHQVFLLSQFQNSRIKIIATFLFVCLIYLWTIIRDSNKHLSPIYIYLVKKFSLWIIFVQWHIIVNSVNDHFDLYTNLIGPILCSFHKI